MLRMARGFRQATDIPAEYDALNRRWRLGGLVSVVLPIASLALMVLR
jgi:hypothetical protein